MYLVAILVIATLLVLCIVWAGRPEGRARAKQSLLAAIGCAVTYEFAVAAFHPEWNVRIEFALIPLFLVALSRVIFPPSTPHSATEQCDVQLGTPREPVAQAPGDTRGSLLNPASLPVGKLASRCLTYSLVSVVFWMFPVLAIAAIYYGHLALVRHPADTDRLKAIIGLVVAYPQVLAAAYLWFLSFLF